MHGKRDVPPSARDVKQSALFKHSFPDWRLSWFDSLFSVLFEGMESRRIENLPAFATKYLKDHGVVVVEVKIKSVVGAPTAVHIDLNSASENALRSNSKFHHRWI